MAAKDLSEMISESARGKAMPYRDYDVSKLRRDGGTQQRPTDPELVKEYAQLRRDGSQPPPVKCVLDDEGNMWLWEGFHRYEAAIEAGTPTLNLSVTRGSQRDAILLSFSANKGHGLRRQPGVLRAIIGRIVSDPDWGKASAASIAEHVGASTRYVEEVISGAAGKAEGGAKRGGGKRKVKRGGTEYEMDVTKMGGNRKAAASAESNGDAPAPAPEPEPEPARPTVDELGNALADPKMIEVFARADSELVAHVKALNAVRRAVLSVAKPPDDSDARKGWRQDPLYKFLDVAGFDASSKNAIDDLKAAMPYALCPVHPDDPAARKDCKWCRGTGWVTKTGHKLATESLEQKEAEPAAAK
jgi:hypothetical protein